MKNFTKHAFSILALSAVLTLPVLAGEKKESITFSRNIVVNGTTIQAGTYDVKFNDQTGEFIILKRGKELAKTTGSLKDRGRKVTSTEVFFSKQGDNAVLSGVTFAGANQTVVVNDGAQAASPSQ
ncbi:MAG TPA: hypothetical protein PLL06_05595 [Acidobacteriota bacterium]|nr:hypothetical protein [Acidobacteriota bacterium]HMW00165.1 hypothetical protein [Acidobacteriota bacterium]HMZ79153.1 hypothetical protein [Acidobacteriota bacterium]HNB70313.1 hypothetical protein [Acidobacteriota bacterium]HND18936.1 hypothetical protein [Acidobacteriota bacterium]